VNRRVTAFQAGQGVDRAWAGCLCHAYNRPMPIALLLTFYCLCVIAASYGGGALPTIVTLTHRRMQLVMSFVGGLMLGVALLHLVPHALAELESIDRLVGWLLGGLLTMFLLIRIFHFHVHEHGDTSDLADAGHPHAGPCEHHHQHHDHRPGQHPFSWLGLALGLSLHTLIDGLALGAAVVAESHKGHAFALAGLGTFLAVALHKPLDALSITSLMAAGGWTTRSIHVANLLFALLCPLGAVVAYWGLENLADEHHAIVGCALAFAAGVFLCIALADLLPEVAFHAHDRVPLTITLLLGIALAWSIGLFEPAHAHSHHEHHDQLHSHPAAH
jgi:zinc and cadmium transporter